MTSLIGLLNRRQTIFVDKFSQLILRDSSEMDQTTSSDNELSDHRREDMKFARRMMLSKDPNDKRFLSLYKLKKSL